MSNVKNGKYVYKTKGNGPTAAAIEEWALNIAIYNIRQHIVFSRGLGLLLKISRIFAMLNIVT